MQEPYKPARQVGGDRVSPVARQLTAGRETQIMELRLRKVPFMKIAQSLGMTNSAVHKAYSRALQRVPTRLARELATEDLEIHDRIEARLWREIEKADNSKQAFSGMQLVLRSLQQRAKLLGLNAPSRLDVNVLKQADEEDATSGTQPEDLLKRLGLEEQQQLLALFAKMKGSD